MFINIIYAYILSLFIYNNFFNTNNKPYVL